jgi:hypothetical protein
MNLGKRRRRGRCSFPELETDVSKTPDISVWVKTEVQIESLVIPVAGAE